METQSFRAGRKCRSCVKLFSDFDFFAKCEALLKLGIRHPMGKQLKPFKGDSIEQRILKLNLPEIDSVEGGADAKAVNRPELTWYCTNFSIVKSLRL